MTMIQSHRETKGFVKSLNLAKINPMNLTELPKRWFGQLKDGQFFYSSNGGLFRKVMNAAICLDASYDHDQFEDKEVVFAIPA